MRSIDADELLKSIETKRVNLIDKYHADGNRWDALCEVEEMIKDAPTIEPKKGEWLWDCHEEGWKCSECNTLIHDICIFEDEMIEEPQVDFCMVCGADMRGAKDEIY